jgi:hypothetical protein
MLHNIFERCLLSLRRYKREFYEVLEHYKYFANYSSQKKHQLSSDVPHNYQLECLGFSMGYGVENNVDTELNAF